MKLATNKIKLIMAEMAITHSVLAERCGVSRQNISATLSRGTCSVVKAGKIAKALGVPVADIVAGG